MFKFKRFVIEDDTSSMKVGTDGVVLGALADCGRAPSRILDVGTGCGVISLILAQRFPDSLIDAIDIDEGSVRESAFNFSNSPWKENLTSLHCNFADYQNLDELKGGYDLIVSNPPYFQNSLKGPDSQRNIARHTDELPLDLLFRGISKLLDDRGTFVGILPYDGFESRVEMASREGLFLKRVVKISNRPSSRLVRVVFWMMKDEPDSVVDEVVSIRDEKNDYSDWYYFLTRDYYYKDFRD